MPCLCTNSSEWIASSILILSLRLIRKLNLYVPSFFSKFLSCLVSRKTCLFRFLLAWINLSLAFVLDFSVSLLRILVTRELKGKETQKKKKKKKKGLFLIKGTLFLQGLRFGMMSFWVSWIRRLLTENSFYKLFSGCCVLVRV